MPILAKTSDKHQKQDTRWTEWQKQDYWLFQGRGMGRGFVKGQKAIALFMCECV